MEYRLQERAASRRVVAPRALPSRFDRACLPIRAADARSSSAGRADNISIDDSCISPDLNLNPNPHRSGRDLDPSFQGLKDPNAPLSSLAEGVPMSDQPEMLTGAPCDRGVQPFARHSPRPTPSCSPWCVLVFRRQAHQPLRSHLFVLAHSHKSIAVSRRAHP